MNPDLITLDTEMPERSIGQGTASLASSIFLVARRREGDEVGDASSVRRELHRIVDLMRHLRGARARQHVREEVPFYTGTRRSVAELVDALP